MIAIAYLSKKSLKTISFRKGKKEKRKYVIFKRTIKVQHFMEICNND